ncbi:MAG: NAD+ synthase [Bacteroidetes bacterium]|nr:NAD+ synthase [Bacteroidota bacterium]
MKVFLSQQNYHIGNFESNVSRILEALREAEACGADLAVFTELCVCGYPPRDFLEFEDFIRRAEVALAEICRHTLRVAAIVGAPARNPDPQGKDLFNAAWLLHEGQVKAILHKTLLPTYDVFDEYRYFEPAFQWEVVPFKGHRLAITICEDIWNLGDNPLYRICPMDQLMAASPDLMINISASPFSYHHDEDRKKVVRSQVLKYGLPMIYTNAVGSQTEIVFDGGSLVYDDAGTLVRELAYFREDQALIDTEMLYSGRQATSSHAAAHADQPPAAKHSHEPADIIAHITARPNIAEIHQALLMGIRDYFRKMGFRQAILGSSGGIDSAVTLALACEALGPSQVRAILMPSPYSTTHSVKDAIELSRRLGNPYDILPIAEPYDAMLQTLAPLFHDTAFGIAEENVQSRIRGNLLMAVANKLGYILLNTSNKSELATGYGTLYGDMAGGLSVLGDLYKTQVYALAEFLNREGEQIPREILDKEPSAELRPGQKDKDSLPEYSSLDSILYLYIERRLGPADIIAKGFETSLVARVLQMVNGNEYKRNQFCPIIRVSEKAFGVGRRVPIVARYLATDPNTP